MPAYGWVRSRWWRRRELVQIGWHMKPLRMQELVDWLALWTLRNEEREWAERVARERRR